MNYKNRSDNYNWFKNNKGNGKSSKDQWKMAWKFTKIFMYFSLFVFSMIGCVQSFMITTTNYVGTGFEIYASEEEIVPNVTEIYVVKEDVSVNENGVTTGKSDADTSKFNGIIQMNPYYNSRQKTAATNTMILKDEKINGVDNALSKIHSTVNNQGTKMSDAYRGLNEAVRFVTTTDANKKVPGFKTLSENNEKVSQFSDGNFMVISSTGNKLMGTEAQQKALVDKFNINTPTYTYYVGNKIYADEAIAGNIVRQSDNSTTEDVKEDRFGNWNGKKYMDLVYAKEEDKTSWKKPNWVEMEEINFKDTLITNDESKAIMSYKVALPYKFNFEKKAISFSKRDREYFVNKGTTVTLGQKNAMIAFGKLTDTDFTTLDSNYKMDKDFATGAFSKITNQTLKSNLESAFENKMNERDSLDYVYLPITELTNDKAGLRDQYSMMMVDEILNRVVSENEDPTKNKYVKDILNEDPTTYSTTHISNPSSAIITSAQRYNYMVDSQHKMMSSLIGYAGLEANNQSIDQLFTPLNDGLHIKQNYMPLYYGQTKYRPIVTWGDSWQLGPFYAFFVYPMGKLSALMISGFPPMAGWEAFFSILIIVLLSRIFTFLLSFKSTLQQTKMTELNAKKAQIDAKYVNYQDNKQMKNRQKQEVADLYKREGVNPMGAFGAMFLTMPIFLAIWRVISGVPALKSTVWLGMTFSDTSYKMLFAGAWQYLPIIIISGVIQYISTKYPQWLTKKRDKLRMNVQQEAAMKKNNKTQNIMAWVMVFMAVVFTAGVQVYWIIGGLWRLVEVTITHKMLHSKKPKKGQLPVPFTTRIKNLFKKQNVTVAKTSTTVVTETKKTKSDKKS